MCGNPLSSKVQRDVLWFHLHIDDDNDDDNDDDDDDEDEDEYEEVFPTLTATLCESLPKVSSIVRAATATEYCNNVTLLS